jgi:CheY-like chemotaxis protein
MAHVVAFIPDLLFGSQVQGSLRAGGHTVDLVGEEGVRTGLQAADVLVLDLTDESARRTGLLESLRADERANLPTLAFYSHVDVEVRRLAEQAGCELVVPRSRMAREGAELVSKLARE